MITLSRPASVSVVAKPRVKPTGGLGQTLKRADPVLRAAGKREIAWRAPTEPGKYIVHLLAETRSVERRSEPLAVVVPEPQREKAGASPAPEGDVNAPDSAATGAEEDDDVGVLGLIAFLSILVVAIATGVLAAKIDRWAK